MNTNQHDAPDPTRTDRSRRLRSSRRSLATMLIAVALIAVAILGLVNIFYARSLLNSTIESQLSAVGEERAVAVKDGIDRLRSSVSAVARDQSIATALSDFSEAFDALADSSTDVDPDQQQELDAFYASAVASTPGLEGTPAQTLVPITGPGRYLQYHYIVTNPNPPDQRSELVDPGDGSIYSTVHARYHRMLAERTEALGADDLLLISAAPGETIVYSTAKHIDFATSLLDGPYRDSDLAKHLLGRLSAVPVGETVLVDFSPYLPNDGRPTMFAAAAVKQGSQVIGAIAMPVPNGVLDDILTFGGRWQEIGLGRSGEIYVVGSDYLMRSVSRFWVEDPEAYLAAVDTQGYPAEVREAIERYGTTVMAQPVDTKAVASAFEDRTYNDTTSNYLGTKTRTIARPLRLGDLDWVIVSGFASSDATRPIRDYLWSLGLIALILVPIVALLGFWFSTRLTRPIEPLVKAVDSIAGGDLNTEVPDLGRNEYGDLANRINTLTAILRERDEERRTTEEAIHELLTAALPDWVATSAREAAKEGRDNTDLRGVGDLVDTCTVISISLSGYFELDQNDADAAVDESVVLASDLERIASRVGIERVRSTPDEYLFAAGLRSPGFAAAEALEFVRTAVARLAVLDTETELDGTYRIGVATGRVASGLQPGDQLSYGIWGAPVRTALSLVGIARPDQVLIDTSTAAELDGVTELEPATAIDLRGEPVSCYTMILRTPDDETSPESENGPETAG